MPYNGKLSLSNKGFLVRVDDYAGNEVSENTLESLLNGDELGTFRGMKVMSNIGRITSLIGAPILGAGIGLALGNLISGSRSPYDTSTMLIIIGGSIMLPGIVIGLVGDGRIRSVLDDYNRRNGYVYTPTIKAGFTPYGMGLTYNF